MSTPNSNVPNPSTLVSLNDDGVVRPSALVFKAKKDEIVRIYIPNPDQIFMYSQHYSKDGNAGFIRCMADAGQACPACEQVQQSVQKFKANIIVYQTGTMDGSVQNINYVVLQPQVLKFNTRDWGSLKAKHKKFIQSGGLAAIDLTLKCTNDAYQHYEFDDIGPCIIAQDQRLTAMYHDAVKKFQDFSKDKDSKFPTPVQMKAWVTAASGGAAIPAANLPNRNSNDFLGAPPPMGALPSNTPAPTAIADISHEANLPEAQNYISTLMPPKQATTIPAPAAIPPPPVSTVPVPSAVTPIPPAATAPVTPIPPAQETPPATPVVETPAPQPTANVNQMLEDV